MKIRNIAATLSAVVLFASLSAPAQALSNDPIEKIRSSYTPFQALEELPSSEKAQVLEHINALTDTEVAVLLKVNTSKSLPSYNGGNLKEKAACVLKVGVSACNTAANDARIASKIAKEKFPHSLHNGKGDAFRHCYWSARMARNLGENTAKIIGELHEDYNPGPEKERRMDLANNYVGRMIARITSTHAQALHKCKARAEEGTLTTIDKL